ncbi:MAG TPA: class IV adenylate cyclase [Tepidisphaeraceae bacterium]|jgi:adenylate cyclase class 2
MASEIEAKMKVDGFDRMRDALAQAGATRIGSVLETNMFFDSPTQTLVSKDTGLRLRRTRDDATNQVRFIITVKGPQQSGQLKNREEAEVVVDDGEDAKGVLAALGFEPTLSFEKRRESWTLDGCKVELDELPVFGRFVEIEGPGEGEVMAVREKLGMGGTPLIQTGYATMIARHLKETGDARGVITFQSYGSLVQGCGGGVYLGDGSDRR